MNFAISLGRARRAAASSASLLVPAFLLMAQGLGCSSSFSGGSTFVAGPIASSDAKPTETRTITASPSSPAALAGAQVVASVEPASTTTLRSDSALGSYYPSDSIAAANQHPKFASESSRITKHDVIDWTSRGVSDENIVERIDRNGAIFRLTAADENQLRDAGVSEWLIQQMKATSRR